MELNYYNARPANITNLGIDVSGAKRHNFDTYETEQEKAVRKSHDKALKEVKEQIKEQALSESPNSEILALLIQKRFLLEHGFDCETDVSELNKRHSEALKDVSLRADFNKTVRAYNKARREIRDCQSLHRFKYFLASLRKTYSAKKSSFIEQTGERFNWANLKESTSIEADIAYLKENSKAVQFGNSVSDKERASILAELTQFLKDWKHTSLADISWSFGARGKAGSVAYYQHSLKVISVNRHLIGALIHEIGHYLDYNKGNPSSRISYETIKEYAESLPSEMDYKARQYYCKREEIFARAFEAYFMGKVPAFALCGCAYLPKLSPELTELIEGVL